MTRRRREVRQKVRNIIMEEKGKENNNSILHRSHKIEQQYDFRSEFSDDLVD